MIDSIEQLTLKTGQEVIIMNHMDIIDTIRDTLGGLLQATRLNRDKLYERYRNIRQLIDNAY